MEIELQVLDREPIPMTVADNGDVDMTIEQEIVREVENDYNNLRNQPAINGHTLVGDQSFAELGLVDATSEADGLMSAADKAALDAIPSELATKQDVLTFDSTPTEGSTNPVTSDGIFKATGNSAFYGCKVPSNTNPPQEVTILNGKTVTDIRRDVKAGKSVVLLVNYLSGGELKTLRFTATGGKDYPLDDPSRSEYYFYGNVTDYYIKLGTDNRLTWENAKVQTTSNLVVTLTAARTHSQYPSAKCVYDALVNKQSKLTFDDTPTDGSTNPVTSDGIYEAIAAKTDVVVYTGFCDYSVGSEVQPAGLNGGKTRADIIADIEANKIVIIRIEDLYMDVYDFVYAGKQNIFNEPPLSNEIAYTFIYNKATDNKCVKLLVASFSNSIQIQKWMDAEVVGNKVTSLSASSTDTQYPSAKCVYTALGGKQNTLTFDSSPTDGSSNPVTSDGVYDALQAKQNTLTFDNAPTGGSSNPVTSDGIYDALPKNTSDLTNDGSDGTSTYVEADDNHDIPAGGNAGQVLKKTSATDYDVQWSNETETYPSGYCTTAAGTNPKIVNCSLWTATANTYLHILIAQANTHADAITMKINASSPIPVYINGAASSTTNYSLPAGTYLAFYDGTNIHLRTDGTLPGKIMESKLTASIPYGECDGTSTATAFTVTVPGITELKNGVCCYVRNNVVTSASGCTLDVNGLGAKPLYSSIAAASRSTTIFNINYTLLFIYNENRVADGCWDVFYGIDSNTNTIGYQIRHQSASLNTTDKFYRYRLLFTSADGTQLVPANTSTSTNATSSRTPTTRPIDPFGNIFYYGTTTAVNANALVPAAQLWQQYAIVLGYSFNWTNAALTLTYPAPTYLLCTPQADGSAVIDATTPIVQALPTSADGKIYIFLGYAYDATHIELDINHPVYYYDGHVKRWNG